MSVVKEVLVLNRLTEAMCYIKCYLLKTRLDFLRDRFFTLAGSYCLSVATRVLCDEDGPAFKDVDLWFPCESKAEADTLCYDMLDAGAELSCNFDEVEDRNYSETADVKYSLRYGRLNFIIYLNEGRSPVGNFDFTDIMMQMDSTYHGFVDSWAIKVIEAKVLKFSPQTIPRLARIQKYILKTGWRLDENSFLDMVHDIYRSTEPLSDDFAAAFDEYIEDSLDELSF